MFSKEVYFVLVLMLFVHRNCGRNLNQNQLQSRIVDGMNATKGQFKSYVQLSSYTPDYSDEYGGYYVADCGCALITPRHGLTAAHCFEGYPLIIKAWVGYSSDNDWKDVEPFYVEFYYVHPYFDIDTLQNDCAIVQFFNEVKTSEYVATITLNCDGAETPKGTPMVVAGHGVTSYDAQELPPNLKYANLVTTSPEECLEIDPFFNSDQICATSASGEQSTCFGDSGSGLMQLTKNTDGDDEYVHCGIVSFGPERCGPKDGFTKTSSFTEFIKGAVASYNGTDGKKYEVTCTELS